MCAFLYPDEYLDSTYSIDFDQLYKEGYRGIIGKPKPSGYRKAMGILGTDTTNTLFVGDQIFTDVCGANLAGIRTILVKPIHPKEEIQIVLKRRLEAIVLLCYRLHRKIVKPKYPSVAKKEDSSIL